MDNWQKDLFMKVSSFISAKFEPSKCDNVTISLNQYEAYVVMKALEDQQRFLNSFVIAEPPEEDK